VIFSEYLKATEQTAIYKESCEYAANSLDDPDTCDLFESMYEAMGLADESGEVLGKIKKILRDDCGDITWARREEIKKEMGDVLFYFARLCKRFGFELEGPKGLMQANIDKLLDRKERGVLQGSGDNR
jgi:NTP pyrophosphatase (non-canonical NTP hydrolase)